MSRADAISVSRGFSVIEMLVVLVILVLLALVSIPWFNKIRRRAEIRSSAMEISTTLAAARMRAVKRNVNVTVVITPAGSVNASSRIATIEPIPIPGGASPLTDLFLSGRAVQFVELPVGGITFDGGGRRVAPLSPTPGPIRIEGPVGGGPVNQITIETNRAGRVRIVTPVVWQ
jgi:prepilin-type N-terminal cleavage/methylation domain-containing protein